LPAGVAASLVAATFDIDVVDAVAGLLDIGTVVVLGTNVRVVVTSTKAGSEPD
jgi:hypothetical protein